MIHLPHRLMWAMMTLPLSIDLRDRIAAALGEGATVRQAAKWFGVSLSSAVRVGQSRKSRPGQGHGKIGGHRRPKLKGETGDRLLARLAKKPDLTMRALATELADRGCMSCMTRFGALSDRRVRPSKNPLMAGEQFRPKVARFRARWRAHRHQLDHKLLIFMDDTHGL